MKTVAIAAGALLLALVTPALGKEMLPIEDFIKRPTCGNLKISPTGEYLAVTVDQGERDPRCPPENTEAMRKALVSAGNTPEGMIILSGEMHGFHKEENNLKLYTEMLAFFARHVGGAVQVGQPEQDRISAVRQK